MIKLIHDNQASLYKIKQNVKLNLEQFDITAISDILYLKTNANIKKAEKSGQKISIQFTY